MRCCRRWDWLDSRLLYAVATLVLLSGFAVLGGIPGRSSSHSSRLPHLVTRLSSIDLARRFIDRRPGALALWNIDNAGNAAIEALRNNQAKRPVAHCRLQPPLAELVTAAVLVLVHAHFPPLRGPEQGQYVTKAFPACTECVRAARRLCVADRVQVRPPSSGIDRCGGRGAYGDGCRWHYRWPSLVFFGAFIPLIGAGRRVSGRRPWLRGIGYALITVGLLIAVNQPGPLLQPLRWSGGVGEAAHEN